MDPTELLRELPPRLSTREHLDVILRAAAGAEASDVYFGGSEPIVMRQHGRLSPLLGRPLTTGEVNSMMTAAYENPVIETQVSGGDPQDFSYECVRASYKEPRLRWRANVTACQKEGRSSSRFILRRITSIPPTLDALQVEPELRQANREFRQGMMIVTGPTGSGKSTLLAAMLRDRLEDPDDHCHIVTLERPTEYVYDQCNLANSLVTPIEVGRDIKDPKASGTSAFSRAVENSLRQDPDLILVGETRDYPTASASLLASLTGHGLYTTTHDTGVPSTIRRLLRIFPQAERHLVQLDLVASIRGIISQLLVPSSDGRRVAIREYLIPDGDVRGRLMRADDVYLETLAALYSHGSPFIADARRKFEAGLISEQEFSRFERAHELNEGQLRAVQV